MFGSLDISTSALEAQRTRMNVVASNLANANSIYNAEGEYEPYQRKVTLFAPGSSGTGDGRGVHVEKIIEADEPLRKVYKPGHPEAGPDGYVKYPNVNPVMARINAMEASRAYEANITAAQATKSMIRTSLQLLG